MAPISWLSWWAVFNGDAVILARAADHRASELFRIVAVDFTHFSPAGPFGLHADGSKPIFFRQYGVRDRESRRESAWLLEVDGESKHNSTVHIDDDGQRRSLDRLAVLLINHNDVHRRMVDLGYG